MFDRVYTKFNEEITFHVDDNIFNVHSANYAYQFKAKKIGRGEVYFIDCNNNKLVLKEYNRGGLIRYFTKNKYLYLGLKRTRPFKEFLMLKKMHELELPVPRPVSIKLSISGFYYTGKIITEEVLNAVNLKKIIISKKINNQIISNIISVLRNLIQNNIFHSDLNINNILIDESLSIYIIDFDNSFFTKRKTLLIKPLDRLIKSIRKEQENKKLIKSISELKDEIILS